MPFAICDKWRRSHATSQHSLQADFMICAVSIKCNVFFPIFNHLLFLQRESALPRFGFIGMPIPKRSWLEVSQYADSKTILMGFLWASHHDELLLWVRLWDQVSQWQSWQCSLISLPSFASLSTFSFLSFPWLSLSLTLSESHVSYGHAQGCFVSSLIVYSSQPLALASAALTSGITLPEVRLVAHTCRLDEVSHWRGNAERRRAKQPSRSMSFMPACPAAILTGGLHCDHLDYLSGLKSGTREMKHAATTHKPAAEPVPSSRPEVVFSILGSTFTPSPESWWMVRYWHSPRIAFWYAHSSSLIPASVLALRQATRSEGTPIGVLRQASTSKCHSLNRVHINLYRSIYFNLNQQNKELSTSEQTLEMSLRSNHVSFSISLVCL